MAHNRLEPGVDFPRNDLEFDKMFGTAKACRDYIYSFGAPKESHLLEVETYWPWRIGLEVRMRKDERSEVIRSVCPICNTNTDPWRTGRDYLICRNKLCSYTTTITEGSFFHNKKKNLEQWFRAIWLMISEKGHLSIEDFQVKLGLGSFQTALFWSDSIRSIMAKTKPYKITSKRNYALDLVRLSELNGILNCKSCNNDFLLVAVTNKSRYRNARFELIIDEDFEKIFAFQKSISKEKFAVLIKPIIEISTNFDNLSNHTEKTGEVKNEVMPDFDIDESSENKFAKLMNEFLSSPEDAFYKENVYTNSDDCLGLEITNLSEDVKNVIGKLNSWLKKMPQRGVRKDKLDLYLKVFSFFENCQYPKKYGNGILFYNFMKQALVNSIDTQKINGLKSQYKSRYLDSYKLISR